MLKNFLLFNANALLGVLFPVVTLPIVLRAIGPSGFGEVSIALAYIGIFSTLCTLGVGTIGLKTLGRVRDDLARLKAEYLRLLYLQCALTICSIFLFTTMYGFGLISINGKLLFPIIIHILLTPLMSDWYFQATLNYKLITLRNFFIRLVTLPIIIFFVIDESDFSTYLQIITLSNVIIAIVNSARIYSIFRSIKATKTLEQLDYFKNFIYASLAALVGMVYLHFDTIIMSFFLNTAEVGQYNLYKRVSLIFISVIASVAVINTPDASRLFRDHAWDDLLSNLNKPLLIILWMSGGVIIASLSFSQEFFVMIGGIEFKDNSEYFVILTIFITASSLCTFWANNLNIPADGEIDLLKANSIGMVAMLIGFFWLVPIFGLLGGIYSICIGEVLTLLRLLYSNRIKAISAQLLSKVKYTLLYVSILTSIGISSKLILGERSHAFLSAAILIYIGYRVFRKGSLLR